jgi:hypothetical protein
VESFAVTMLTVYLATIVIAFLLDRKRSQSSAMSLSM